MKTDFPSTRSAALEQLEAFVPKAIQYAGDRNYVFDDHSNVSRLSPAVSSRLILEAEVVAAMRARHAPEVIEKFEQEVWWRIYWKGWLEKRPSIWTDYCEQLQNTEWTDRARQVASGDSGVDIMDRFAKELVETGYLHNHARMWWASFWIHVERLPWQLGADFFLQHLIDGDAASNTLSWRWVAGLHTEGKSYLVRRSNLERYLAADILKSNPRGMERLEEVGEAPIEFQAHPAPLKLEAEPTGCNKTGANSGRVGLWVHEEDLLLEDSPLKALEPDVLFGCQYSGGRASEVKSQHRSRALDDGLGRAGEHFCVRGHLVCSQSLSKGMVEIAKEQSLSTIFAMRLFIGPLADQVGEIEQALSEVGAKLELVRRPDDVVAMDFATAGFFGFWKKTQALRR